MKDNEIKNPEETFVKLFKTLRLENFSDDFLRDELLIEPLVKQSMECHEMIFSALLNTTNPRIDKGFCRGVAYIIACHSQSRMLQRLDVRSKEWKRFARISADILEKPIDLVGVNGEVYLTSVDAISKFRDGKLVHLVNTGLKPVYHQCIARGNVIYMVSSQYVVKYNTRSNTWITSSSELFLGGGFFVTSSEQHIYAMGGEGTRNSAKEFDFNTETWEPMPYMQLGREFGAAVWFDCKVYALGGADGGWNQTEFYSQDTNTWTKVSPDIRCAHYKCKAFTIGTTVYIVGGTERKTGRPVFVSRCSFCGINLNNNPVSSVAMLDLKTSKIESIPSMEVENGLACAVYIE